MTTTRKIEIEDKIRSLLPGYRAILIEADVKNSETTVELKKELELLERELKEKYEIPEINKIPGIASTRAAYKLCGKDPNRYRPSQEQLMRRIVRGLGLYNVNNLVDCGNILSLKTGCSVGCFDADIVEGDKITLGIGKENEPYVGIGRGEFNIQGLPVFRDNVGGIGTPTSDNERTKLTLSTRHLLVTVHLFDTEIVAQEVVDLFTDIFSRHGEASNIRWEVFSPKNIDSGNVNEK